MGGVEVSVMGLSSTLANVCPSTRPSCVRNSHMCIKPGVIVFFCCLSVHSHFVGFLPFLLFSLTSPFFSLFLASKTTKFPKH